jgi:hypothetical protein
MYIKIILNLEGDAQTLRLEYHDKKNDHFAIIISHSFADQVPDVSVY